MMEIDNNVERLLVSADTVAWMCAVSRRQIYRLLDAGRIPAPVRLGGSVRWRSDEIAEWIKNGCPSVRQSRKIAS